MTTDAGTPRTVEQRLEEWEKLSGSRVRTQEHQFIAAMRFSASLGVGYGWMQQIIEWEWQTKDGYAHGPEAWERSLTAAETDRDALRARVAGLEASEKLLQQAHSAVLRSLQKQAPCFADTDRLDAMEKQSWTVGHYASGRYFVHLGLINGKQCETTGSALRIAIDEARALLAPSSEETK